MFKFVLFTCKKRLFLCLLRIFNRKKRNKSRGITNSGEPLELCESDRVRSSIRPWGDSPRRP